MINYKLAKEIGATHYRECINDEIDYYKMSDKGLKLFCYSFKSNEWEQSITSNAVAVSSIKKIPPKRTRTEYEKVTEFIFDLRDEFERGELYAKGRGAGGDFFRKITTEYELIAFASCGLYRKIEKEIDWREEVYEYLGDTEFHWSTPVAEVINAESDCFLELCRVALRANGEIE